MDPRYNTYPQRQAQQAQPQVTQRQHQRFSWQAPLDTDTAPPSQSPPQFEQVYPQRQQPVINTNVATQHSRGFSYAPTPIEHNGSAYHTSSSNNPTNPSSPVFTPIDDRPQSMFNMLNTPARRQSQQAYGNSSHARDEETLLSPSSPEAQTLPFMLVESAVGGDEVEAAAAAATATTPTPQPQHPPQPQPAPTSQSPVQQSRHARQMSALAPLTTNFTQQKPMPAIPQSPRSGSAHPPSPGALPYKTPISPMSTHPIRSDTPHNTTLSHPFPSSEPYSPHGLPTHNILTAPGHAHAVFTPSAAHGPNGLDAALHQPGQIRHPNMSLSSSKTWSHSLCSCGPDPSLCLTGLFCPCILSGRTAHRLSLKSQRKDPTDLLGHSTPNAHCLAMSFACGVGLGWVFPALLRSRIRHVYKLEEGGDCAGDCIRGCCCCCCVAVLNEREVRGREEKVVRWAGPAGGKDGREEMVYRPQN